MYRGASLFTVMLFEVLTIFELENRGNNLNLSLGRMMVLIFEAHNFSETLTFWILRENSTKNALM